MLRNRGTDVSAGNINPAAQTRLQLCRDLDQAHRTFFTVPEAKEGKDSVKWFRIPPRPPAG